jgi:hypothetical protein
VRSLGPALGALLLCACPLPQSVPQTDSTITPPRIVEDDSLSPRQTRLAFDPSCLRRQAFTIQATVGDENDKEPVEYRWFVDYQPSSQERRSPLPESGTVEGPQQPPRTRRPLPPLTFFPADFGAAAHVLELTVSNGFLGGDQNALAFPWRTPSGGFEIQSFRWLFEAVPGSGGCPP